MKQKEKSNKTRETIIDVAGRLFLAQGYQQTTIRQVVKEAGINIGTLYYFFRDKEDIFLHISKQTLINFMDYVEQLTAHEKDNILKYAVYRALEFKAIQKSDMNAALYLESYSSWRMTQMVIQANMKINKLYFHEYNKSFTKLDYYRISMALRGMRLMFIAERVYTGVDKYKEYTHFIIEKALAAFNVPKDKRDASIKKAMEIVKKQNITMFGLNII